MKENNKRQGVMTNSAKDEIEEERRDWRNNVKSAFVSTVSLCVILIVFFVIILVASQGGAGLKDGIIVAPGADSAISH